jgi:hypothetical protein
MEGVDGRIIIKWIIVYIYFNKTDLREVGWGGIDWIDLA